MYTINLLSSYFKIVEIEAGDAWTTWGPTSSPLSLGIPNYGRPFPMPELRQAVVQATDDAVVAQPCTPPGRASLRVLGALDASSNPSRPRLRWHG